MNITLSRTLICAGVLAALISFLRIFTVLREPFVYAIIGVIGGSFSVLCILYYSDE